MPKLFVLGIATVLAVLLAFVVVGAVYAKPQGMKIEVRYCRPLSDPDESQEVITCSCTVSDWIDDGDGKILVCER
jgi:UPF0716 family protein affecting phage T7 exclusion